MYDVRFDMPGHWAWVYQGGPYDGQTQCMPIEDDGSLPRRISPRGPGVPHGTYTRRYLLESENVWTMTWKRSPVIVRALRSTVTGFWRTIHGTQDFILFGVLRIDPEEREARLMAKERSRRTPPP